MTIIMQSLTSEGTKKGDKYTYNPNGRMREAETDISEGNVEKVSLSL